MGPDNPWSPNWRPDPSGHRLATIRAARRGGLLAGIVYLPVGASVLAVSDLPDTLALIALLVGLPAVALLGAGLASSALGSAPEAAATGLAFAIGAPVAAVTSLVIGAFVVSLFAPGHPDLAGMLVRTGVTTALGVAPLVAAAAAVWVVAVRLVARPRTAAPPTSSSPGANGLSRDG